MHNCICVVERGAVCVFAWLVCKMVGGGGVCVIVCIQHSPTKCKASVPIQALFDSVVTHLIMKRRAGDADSTVDPHPVSCSSSWSF